MDETTRKGRELDALENIVKELVQLRVLREHELGVQLEEAPEGSGPYVPSGASVPTERHTVEVSFEGELVSSITDKSGTNTLYRTPDDTYFVHIDMRRIAEEAVARGIPRDAVLDDGHAGLGHSESFARYNWPELFTPQARR